MKLFSAAEIDKIAEVARKSNQALVPPKTSKVTTSELQSLSQKVVDYFKDSPAILIHNKDELHEYVTNVIEAGYAGIDTETTGLDVMRDYIVGASLYYPGGVECYIPSKHLQPLFDEPYKDQLSYEDIGAEFQRLKDSEVKLIFANADFDLAMMTKDFKVNLADRAFYDVILAWRCIKENEPDNALKVLYNKYVLKGKGDPMKFSDFFNPSQFPYCKPEVAKLYAANDAKITFDLFKWQLPFVTKSNDKCQRNHLEGIADLVWNIETPLIKLCSGMHETGIFLDIPVAQMIQKRYQLIKEEEDKKLANMVQKLLDDTPLSYSNPPPFNSGAKFNPNSPVHVKYLVYNILNVPKTGAKETTDKEFLANINLPVTNQILNVRKAVKMITTYTDKMPKSTGSDNRIHARFKSIGADTGRMSSAEPNMQNIPSHATDVRHMFRASVEQVRTEDLDTDSEDISTASITLPNYEMLNLSDNSWKTVKELEVGDEIKLKHDGVLEFHMIQSIERHNIETQNNTTLVFG